MYQYERNQAAQPLFDEEAGRYEPNTKLAKTIRHGFMRKVYGIVLMQLLCTTGLCLAASFNESVTEFLAQPWVLILGAIGSVVCQLVIGCNRSASQIFPINYAILGLFTAFFSVSTACLVGVVSNRVKGGNTIIVQALVITVVIVMGLTAFAMQTKYDFVSFTGILCIFGFAILGASLLRLIFPRTRWLNIAIAAATALLMAAYLVVDTQLLANRLKEDEYIAAAMMLYVDIVTLFMSILQILLFSRNSNND